MPEHDEQERLTVSPPAVWRRIVEDRQAGSGLSLEEALLEMVDNAPADTQADEVTRLELTILADDLEVATARVMVEVLGLPPTTPIPALPADLDRARALLAWLEACPFLEAPEA